MRIANKLSPSKRTAIYAGTAFLLALGALPLTQMGGARADDAPPAIPPIATATASPMAVPDAMPVTPPALAAPSTGMPVLGEVPAVSVQPVDFAKPAAPGGSEMNKNVSALEEKASDSAKGMVKRLDSASTAMTLEDLNSARQVVARLEAMIDVEKHLAELDKIRGERGHGSGASLASSIPASALAPPKSLMQLPAESVVVARPIEKPKLNAAGIEIVRITGADGKYSAVLKLPNGEIKPVRIGDEIGDHTTVRWISASTVLIEESGSTHSLHIKNVNAIFSAMR